MVAAEDAPLLSEEMKLYGTGQVHNEFGGYKKEHTFTGTKFKVYSEGWSYEDSGVEIITDYDTNENWGMVISSLDGTVIKKVDLRFSYYDGEHNGTVSAAPGSLSAITVVNDDTCDATATITNVNATSVRVSSSFQSDRQKGPTIDEVTIYYEGKYANTLTASDVKATQTLTFKTKAQNLSKASVFNVTGAQGAVTFSKKSGNAGITVSADGKVTVKKSLAVGTYKAVTRKAKASKVAKKAVTVARPIKVTKQQGKLKYAKVKKGSSKYLSVNKKNGKVTVKKGTPKGTYKIKIKVAAAGNSNYKAGSKTVTCKIKVA